MNKHWLFLFFTILFCAQLQAQDRLIFSQELFPADNLTQQTAFIKNAVPETSNEKISFQLRFFNQSPHSKHYTFDVLFDNTIIYTNFIKVNTDNQNKIISIANGTGDFSKFSNAQFDWERNLWANKKDIPNLWELNQIVKNIEYVIFQNEGRASLVRAEDAWDKTYDKTKLINLAGEVVAQWNHQRNLGIDTFINANVFIPDPMTFLNLTYGSPYIDSNDQDLPWMAAAYVPVNIPAVYDTFVNKFFIENDYIKIVDLQGPNIVPSNSATNNFYFNRSQFGFEECMAAYHITQFHDHMSALGYDTLMDLQLDVDVHGQFGADNSSFNRNGGIPNLIFGDGGVDDAEDADVIIHEYGHGISWSANKNTHTGAERPALDEGIGDYFATSYSRHLSINRWQDVFTWDGHNSFFAGRTATTSNNYSSPSPLNLYGIGEIWNAALQKIYTDLGRNATDALMLETLFFLTDSTNLPSAAHYMLQADDLLNGGANKPIICQHFFSKNLLSSDCYPTAITPVQDKENFFTIINSNGFSQGSGNAIIEFKTNQSHQIQFFNINGSMLLNEKCNDKSLLLDPSNYKPGIYILRLYSEHTVQTIKLSRQ